MLDVRNSKGKLVCKVDECKHAVEIAYKGCITLIRFGPDGSVEIINTEEAA